jgi:hypothetical protein
MVLEKKFLRCLWAMNYTSLIQHGERISKNLSSLGGAKMVAGRAN